jgi:hypothetical protein
MSLILIGDNFHNSFQKTASIFFRECVGNPLPHKLKTPNEKHNAHNAYLILRLHTYETTTFPLPLWGSLTDEIIIFHIFFIPQIGLVRVDIMELHHQLLFFRLIMSLNFLDLLVPLFLFPSSLHFGFPPTKFCLRQRCE